MSCFIVHPSFFSALSSLFFFAECNQTKFILIFFYRYSGGPNGQIATETADLAVTENTKFSFDKMSPQISETLESNSLRFRRGNRYVVENEINQKAGA